MATFTPEQYEHYKTFFDTHSNEVAEFIMNSKYDFTPESLIKLGNDEAQKISWIFLIMMKMNRWE